MPANPRYQTAMNQRTHIPSHVEAAMNQHMQQSMPAHLKKYVNGSTGYVPRQAEKQITQFMEKSMPAHMKQYAGAYMQQRVIQPSSANPRTSMERRPVASVAPMPDKLKLSHNVANEQHTVTWSERPTNTPDPLAPASYNYENQNPTQAPVGPHAPEYDFIMSPGEQPKKKFSTPGGGSFVMKLLFGAGALLLAVIVFVFLKGLFFASGINTASFVTVAQDQQNLIHLTTAAAEETDLSIANTNFIATAQLSLSSSQSELIQYLSVNKKKVDAKLLSAKISAANDERLKTAAAATTYNDTFKEIMKAEITTYMTDLQKTYDQNQGKKGREILSKSYDQAKLLLVQLDSTTN